MICRLMVSGLGVKVTSLSFRLYKKNKINLPFQRKNQLKIGCLPISSYMLRKLVFPHHLIIVLLAMTMIWVLDMVRLNLHFLDPFNKGVKDYEVTDIVYSRLRDESIELDTNIVLVNSGRPDRDTLQRMLARIIDAQPKAIGIDLLFSERKSPVTDSLLQLQLKRFQSIALASRLENYHEETGEFDTETDCDPYFRDFAYTGFTNFPANETRTIRLFSPRERTREGESLAFAVRLAKLFAPEKAEALLNRKKEVEEIYYFGGADNFLQFEPDNILDTSVNLKPLLKNKVVILGFLGTYNWDSPSLDRHFTPMNSHYTGRNLPDTYGIVIHANIIKMILDNVYVKKFSHFINFLLTFLFCYLNIHLFYKFYHRVKSPYHSLVRLAQVTEIILLFLLVALAFHYFRYRIDVAFAVAVMLVSFDVTKFYEHVLRKNISFLQHIPDQLPERKAPKKPAPPPTPPAKT